MYIIFYDRYFTIKIGTYAKKKLNLISLEKYTISYWELLIIFQLQYKNHSRFYQFPAVRSK